MMMTVMMMMIGSWLCMTCWLAAGWSVPSSPPLGQVMFSTAVRRWRRRGGDGDGGERGEGGGDEDGDEENGNESDDVDWLTKFPPQCNRHMKK